MALTRLPFGPLTDCFHKCAHSACMVRLVHDVSSAQTGCRPRRSPSRFGSLAVARERLIQKGRRMHRRLFLALAVALIAVNLPTATVSGQEDPASVILRFQDARNRGDVESAMAFVAPGLVYTGGAACPPESPCV